MGTCLLSFSSLHSTAKQKPAPLVLKITAHNALKVEIYEWNLKAAAGPRLPGGESLSICAW